MPRFDAERFRSLHRRRGETYRWQKAIEVEDQRVVATAERDGRIYAEQSVNAAWRALVDRTIADYVDAEFGPIKKGTMQISVMPDETFLGRLDRIILTQRQELARPMITRSASGATDDLVHDTVVSVRLVRQGTTTYTPVTHYTVANSQITWVGATKPANDSKYFVEYVYNPTYIFVGDEQLPRPDKDGTLMPQRGALLEKLPD